MSILRNILKSSFSLLVKVAPRLSSKLIYYKTFRKRLDLKNPVTINEKLMWLKLNEDDALKTKCTDKYLVRNYVKELGYSNLLNEIYHVYDRVEDLNFEELPNKFVIKCTHGSGFNIICTNKVNLDKDKIIRKLKKWMKTNYSLVNCEPHYSKIKPRILIEKFLEGCEQADPIDYKFHCFHGEPQIIEVVVDRWNSDKREILFDCNWNILPYNEASLNFKETINQPFRFNEMLEISRNLSKEFTYSRVDLYYHNNEIYFGELTFTPDACLDTDFINDGEYQMGELLDLSQLINRQFTQDYNV